VSLDLGAIKTRLGAFWAGGNGTQWVSRLLSRIGCTDKGCDEDDEHHDTHICLRLRSFAAALSRLLIAPRQGLLRFLGGGTNFCPLAWRATMTFSNSRLFRRVDLLAMVTGFRWKNPRGFLLGRKPAAAASDPRQ
jgi:hypothetical protein